MDNKLPEARLPREFILDAFADPSSVRDVVRGILHTIFHHRYFPTITPHTHDVLDLTLPYVAEPELETLIDQRTAALVADLALSPSSSAPTTPASLPQQAKAMLGGVVGGVGGGGRDGNGGGGGGGGGGRGRVTVQFLEKSKAGRRRMGMGMGMWGGKGEEDVCWESWTVRVTVAEPKTESERAKVRRATASTLLTTTMKIITSVNTYKDHIPPITMQGDANPFPYAIMVNQRTETAGGGGGMMRGFF